MTKHYFITKNTFSCIILFLIGLFVFFYNIVLAVQIATAKPLDELTEEQIKKAHYVKCTINKVLVKNVVTSSKPSNMTYMANYSTFFHSYLLFTMSYKENRYVQIGIYSDDLKDILMHSTSGTCEPETIIAKVSSSLLSDISWYQGIEGFQIQSLLSNVTLLEINKSAPANWAANSFAYLVIVAYCFRRSFKSIIEQPEIQYHREYMPSHRSFH